jgi:hypothetical protein
MLATFAHNLLRWTAALGGLATGPVVAKTLRRRYLTLPGRITRSARRLTLHLPAGWPWRDAFVEALSRLRTVTIAQRCCSRLSLRRPRWRSTRLTPTRWMRRHGCAAGDQRGQHAKAPGGRTVAHTG